MNSIIISCSCTILCRVLILTDESSGGQKAVKAEGLLRGLVCCALSCNETGGCSGGRGGSCNLGGCLLYYPTVLSRGHHTHTGKRAEGDRTNPNV